jgi:O-antigen ligase
MKRPLCGYGFVAGETEALSEGGAAAITAHNVFLSAFLSVGIVGPLLFLAFFGWLIHVSLRSDLPGNWRPALLGTTIMVLITSIASPGLGARVYGAWVPSVLICMAISTLAISDTLRELNAVTMGWSREMLSEPVL